MKMTKLLITLLWGISVLLVNKIGDLLAQASDWFDWSVLGWAFGGSTVFVLVEAIQGKKRKGWQRVAIVAICVFLSISPLNSWACKRFDMDKELISVLIGLFGYPLLGKQFKKVDKAESIDDIKP